MLISSEEISDLGRINEYIVVLLLSKEVRVTLKIKTMNSIDRNTDGEQIQVTWGAYPVGTIIVKPQGEGENDLYLMYDCKGWFFGHNRQSLIDAETLLITEFRNTKYN